MSRLEAIRQRLEGRSNGAHVAYESEFGCGGFLLTEPGDEEFFAWAGDDVLALLVVTEAARGVLEPYTVSNGQAVCISCRAWLGHQQHQESCWWPRLRDALAALEGE